MSHMYHTDGQLTPAELLAKRDILADDGDDPVDNTTQRGRDLVRQFLSMSEPGEVRCVRSRRVLLELGILADDGKPDPVDSRMVGAVLSCIHSGMINDEQLGSVTVERWSESTERTTWRIVVPEAWPEVVDDE